MSNIVASTHPLPQHPKKILRRHAGVISAELQRAASRDSFHVLGKRKISEDTKPGRYRKLRRRSFSHIHPPRLIHVFFSKILACWEVDLVPSPQPHYRNNVQTSEMQRLENHLDEGFLAVDAGRIQLSFYVNRSETCRKLPGKLRASIKGKRRMWGLHLKIFEMSALEPNS